MKKRKKQIAKFLKLGVFLFGFSLLLWNCEKDNNLPQEEETGVNQTSELYQAKNWLEKNENDLLILKYTQLIDWDNAILSHGIQGTIIEVPLILNENIVTKMENNKTLLSFHRLVLKKEASNMFSIFHLQITTSNTTFNNSNKAFNYYSLQQNFDGYTTLVDVNNKVASFNEFYQGKIITKPESIASREVMTCTYVGWWSNGTFEPISELWCTSEGGSNGEDDGESGYNYGSGGGTNSSTNDDQSYDDWNRLTECEKEFFKSNPSTVFSVTENRKKAEEATSRLFPNCGLRNTLADAFRHAYFSALNTKSIGYSNASKLGDAHECETPSSELDEKIMDLKNNSWGYNYSLNHLNLTESQFHKDFISADKNNEIKTLKSCN